MESKDPACRQTMFEAVTSKGITICLCINNFFTAGGNVQKQDLCSFTITEQVGGTDSRIKFYYECSLLAKSHYSSCDRIC